MGDSSTSNGYRNPGEPQPELLPALRRQWLVIFVLAVIGAAVGSIYYSAQPVVFEARSTLLLIAAGDEVSPGGGRDRTLDVDTWATVARSTELLTQVADELDLGLEEVRRRSTSVANPTGDVLHLTFEAESAADAVAGATVYSNLFLETRSTTINAATVEAVQQLEQLAATMGEQIDALAMQIDEEEARGEDASQSRLAILISAQQRASERLAEISAELVTLDADVETGRVLIDPSTAVSRAGLGRPVTVVSGLALGALFGVIVALLRDRYDDRFGGAVGRPDGAGIRELGRVDIVDFRNNRVDLTGYDRLATKLVGGSTTNLTSGRVILMLPVERRTLPADAAVSVANAIESVGPNAALSVAVRVVAPTGARSSEYWANVGEALDELRPSVDAVLVPALPLDASSIALRFAPIVDRVVLLVTADTRMSEIEAVQDDLSSVDVEAREVIVLQSVRRHHLNGTTLQGVGPNGQVLSESEA